MSDTAYKCHGCQRVFLTRQRYERHICTYPINDRRSGTPVVPVPTAEPTGWRRGHGRRQLRSTVTYGIAAPTAESDSYRARAERMDLLLAQRERERDFVTADRDSLAMQLAPCQAALRDMWQRVSTHSRLLSRAQDYIAHDGHYACTITDCQCGMYALSAEIAAALAPLDPLVPTPLEVAAAEVARLHAALDAKPQPAADVVAK